jgi:hypothetical protein
MERRSKPRLNGIASGIGEAQTAIRASCPYRSRRSLARYSQSASVRGNRKTTSLRRVMSHVRVVSCSTIICSTLGGNRVMPFSACEKSKDGSAMWAQLKTAVQGAIAIGRRIATLEGRVSALETQLEKRPPDGCSYCGERAMRRIPSQNDNILMGRGGSAPHYEEVWRCEKCSKTVTRAVRL